MIRRKTEAECDFCGTKVTIDGTLPPSNWTVVRVSSPVFPDDPSMGRQFINYKADLCPHCAKKVQWLCSYKIVDRGPQ